MLAKWTRAVVAVLCLGGSGGAGCSDCTNDADEALRAPEHHSRELFRATRGDRAITVTAAVDRGYEGAVTTGGRLPGWQPAGVRLRLRVVVGGVMGELGEPELAVLTQDIQLESALDEAQRNAFDVQHLVVEACEAPDRIAFRVRTDAGAAAPRMGDAFIGAYLLKSSVTLARALIPAATCEAALAALPEDIDTWLTAELTQPAPVPHISRAAVLTRAGSVRATERTNDAPAAAVVAAAEGRAVGPVLAWFVNRMDTGPEPVDAFLGDRVSHDADAARALLAILNPRHPSPANGYVPPIARLVDLVPVDIVRAEVASLTNSVVTTCAQREETEACSDLRLFAVSRLAARAQSATACDALASFALTLGTMRARALVFRELTTCATTGIVERAALDLVVRPYEDVDRMPWRAVCLGNNRSAPCHQPALFGAMWLAEHCSAHVVTAVRAAAPQATSVQQQAIACVLAVCAPDVIAETIATMPPTIGLDQPSSAVCWPSTDSPN